MIIRKPYAFLIKHFKIIHIGIFLIFGYLLLSFRDWYTFFKNVIVNNNYSGGMGLEGKYTSFFLLFAIILLIFLAFSIYFLMKKKNKPVLFYQIVMGYGVLALLFFFVYRGYFASVGSDIFSSRTLVLYRDSSLIIYVPAYAFVAFSFVRAFGFDIKKFSFEKDKKELNITSSDNEEVELNINVDKDKIVNSIRRERRQLKYFIEDNKVILRKLLIAVIAIVGIYFAISFFITNKTYSMNTWIPVKYLDSQVKVNKVYLTNLDPYQSKYSTKYKYVGVIFDLSVGRHSIAYGNSMLRLNINGKSYFPIQTSSSLLSDMGSFCKSGTKFVPRTKYENLVVIFEYDKDINVRNLSLEMYMDDGKYHKIRTDYVEQENSKQGYPEYAFKYGEYIPVLGGMKIYSYKIHENTVSYQIPSCEKGNCPLYTKRIQPNLNEHIMELDVEYTENKENIKNLEYYVSILYDVDGVLRLDSAKALKILDHVSFDGNQKLYLSVHSDILSSSKKYLVISTRDAKYKLLLTNEFAERYSDEDLPIETDDVTNDDVNNDDLIEDDINDNVNIDNNINNNVNNDNTNNIDDDFIDDEE